MRVCVVGAGGREHALAAALGRSAEVVVTPGNPGIPGSTPAPPEEVDADLFVIGPEVPLVDGLADRLRSAGRLVFGPGADGARLEGSKAWMKQVLADVGIPTAAHGVFDRVEPALAFLDTLPPPWVVKTDGLAAGKGVLVTDDRREAADDVRAKLSGQAFGDAGRRVVVEEGLDGAELSLLCLCDGRRAVPLAPAQDFKRLNDGDDGPNTGGMGAYSPVPAAGLGVRATQAGLGVRATQAGLGVRATQAGPDVVAEVMARAVEPTLRRLRALGIDFRGVLYAGIILTAEGPKVLEYNVRFGDPETQVVLPLLASDLAGLLAEAAAGDLRTEPSFSSDAAVTVVLAAEGYPAPPRTGDVIAGLEAAAARPGVSVYCAGVGRDPGGRLVTAGGRVLDVTALGPDLDQARRRAYAGVAEISWPGMQYRRDIALSALEGSKA